MAEAHDTSTLSEHQKMMLNIERDTAFMQSFLRVDLGHDSDLDDDPSLAKKSDDLVGGIPPVADVAAELTTLPSEKQHRDGDTTPRPPAKTTFSQLTRDMQLEKVPRRRKGRVRRQEESYTDKDRAAAVNLGSRDIKHSLKEKKRKDRSRALQIPDEADSGTLLALGNHEMRGGNVDNAINFVHKALELNPNDKNALVARSKCYLLMGEPKMALQDAETALQHDKTFIRAIFQKAESLYHLGDFEHSLMFYHRGQRIRPELEGFRLGVQKAQEAIENTIGGKTLPCIITKPPSPATARQVPVETNSVPDRKAVVSATNSSKRSESSQSKNRSVNNGRRKSSNRFLGELCVDKVYLEQLLTHPDIKCGHQDSSAEHILSYAQEGVAFLNNRQEFWRQQRSSTVAHKNPKRHQSSC